MVEGVRTDRLWGGMLYPVSCLVEGITVAQVRYDWIRRVDESWYKPGVENDLFEENDLPRAEVSWFTSVMISGSV